MFTISVLLNWSIEQWTLYTRRKITSIALVNTSKHNSLRPYLFTKWLWPSLAKLSRVSDSKTKKNTEPDLWKTVAMNDKRARWARKTKKKTNLKREKRKTMLKKWAKGKRHKKNQQRTHRRTGNSAKSARIVEETYV